MKAIEGVLVQHPRAFMLGRFSDQDDKIHQMVYVSEDKLYYGKRSPRTLT